MEFLKCKNCKFFWNGQFEKYYECPKCGSRQYYIIPKEEVKTTL